MSERDLVALVAASLITQGYSKPSEAVEVAVEIIAHAELACTGPGIPLLPHRIKQLREAQIAANTDTIGKLVEGEL